MVVRWGLWMQRKSVLIVDDEVALARVFSRGLASQFDVRVATTGREALRLLRLERFDAVVCDLQLGDINGRDLFRTISRERPELGERFVFISGGSVDAADLQFLATVPSIAKPCSSRELLAMLSERLCGHS